MECKMFTEYKDGKPVAYRYGEPWVAMQLFMEGGFSTKEEAIEAWDNYLKSRLDNTSN